MTAKIRRRMRQRPRKWDDLNSQGPNGEPMPMTQQEYMHWQFITDSVVRNHIALNWIYACRITIVRPSRSTSTWIVYPHTLRRDRRPANYPPPPSAYFEHPLVERY